MSNEIAESDIGAIDDFPNLPAEVVIDGAPYWLVLASGGGYRLLLSVCPHAGGEIRPAGEVLFCPLHFWTFDAESGACLNDPDEKLRSREVVVRDRRLLAVGPLL